MKMKNSIQIDDPEILDMDPVQKMWMYENWVADQGDNIDLAKNHAYLLASFWNPEAVKKILGDTETFVSTDEEFEESSAMVQQINKVNELKKKNEVVKKRKRRTLKD